MKTRLTLTTFALALTTALSSGAFAEALIVSPNGFAQIGINDDGSLDANTSAGLVGIGYKFTGQGGRTGFQDALTPGCACEAWGVSANGIGGQVGQTTGNQNITVLPSSTAASTFTSNTALGTLSGLTITQVFSLGTETATGALFKNQVTIHNGTGANVTDLRYARAMDWDVPPTEFSEFVTMRGTTTTTSLLHSTDNGFANANPLTAINDPGIIGPIDADGTTGPSDHGSLFVFGFGDLLADTDFTFNIFYGAGANGADALALLGAISPELYSLGQSTSAGGAATGLPTYVFAFNGVGGSVVIPPPSGVPAPATLWLIGAGLLGFAAKRRRRI